MVIADSLLRINKLPVYTVLKNTAEFSLLVFTVKRAHAESTTTDEYNYKHNEQVEGSNKKL